MKQTYTHAFTASRKAADKKVDERFMQIISRKNTNEITNEAKKS